MTGGPSQNPIDPIAEGDLRLDARNRFAVELRQRLQRDERSDRPLLEHELADGAPAEMGVDALDQQWPELLHLQREGALHPHDHRRRLRGFTRRRPPPRPVDLERARARRQPLADDLRPERDDGAPGKTLGGKRGRDAVVDQLCERFGGHGCIVGAALVSRKP